MKQPHRINRWPRLPEFDYRTPGGYFITTNTDFHEPILGIVLNEEVVLSDLGQIVEKYLIDTPSHFENVRLDYFAVMPSHVHAIFVLTDVTGTASRATTRISVSTKKPATLSALVGGFKSAASRAINLKRGTPGAPVWQKNYYEHVIRDDRDLYEIREYILNNPLAWDLNRRDTDGR